MSASPRPPVPRACFPAALLNSESLWFLQPGENALDLLSSAEAAWILPPLEKLGQEALTPGTSGRKRTRLFLP